jgi:hypothetical protein
MNQPPKMIALSPAFAGWSLFLPSPWGSAALHPRLYAVTCSAG